MSFWVSVALFALVCWFFGRKLKRAIPQALAGVESLTNNVMGAAAGRRPGAPLPLEPDHEPVDLDAFVPDSLWVSPSGQTYTVLGLANLGSSDPQQHPISVVYRDSSGRLLMKRAASWNYQASTQSGGAPSC